jgi:hypothetical protein
MWASGLQVGIGSGDCRELPFAQIRDRLRELEFRIEVGVVGAAAIPSPPTSIEVSTQAFCEFDQLIERQRVLAAYESGPKEPKRSATLRKDIGRCRRQRYSDLRVMQPTDLRFMSIVGNCKFNYFAAQMTTHETA